MEKRSSGTCPVSSAAHLPRRPPPRQLLPPGDHLRLTLYTPLLVLLLNAADRVALCGGSRSLPPSSPLPGAKEPRHLPPPVYGVESARHLHLRRPPPWTETSPSTLARQFYLHLGCTPTVARLDYQQFASQSAMYHVSPVATPVSASITKESGR
ncbi:hypothetical protein DFJ73DRAFT_779464 [Zopfochytrium polystomum]|nr:hypothetical protein DFJ73DRAFT_779464 [Zopfochytrium polystomum]